MKKSRVKAERGTLKKVLLYLKPYWFLVIVSILLSALTVALTLYVPVLVGRVIDHVIGAGKVDFASVGKLLLRIGIVAACTALLQWIVTSIHNRVTYHVVRDVRD